MKLARHKGFIKRSGLNRVPLTGSYHCISSPCGTELGAVSSEYFTSEIVTNPAQYEDLEEKSVKQNLVESAFCFEDNGRLYIKCLKMCKLHCILCINIRNHKGQASHVYK